MVFSDSEELSPPTEMPYDLNSIGKVVAFHAKSVYASTKLVPFNRINAWKMKALDSNWEILVERLSNDTEDRMFYFIIRANDTKNSCEYCVFNPITLTR